MTDRGKRVMDDIRAEEHQLLAARQGESDSATRSASLVIALGSAAALALMTLISIFVGRDTNRYVKQVREGGERLVRSNQELTEAVKALDSSNREKEVLLQEVHHRVKNKLQVITSMFSLQTRLETDSHTVDVLNEGQRRVRVMARLHEALYQSDDLSSIEASPYLEGLLADTEASIMVSPSERITFDLDVDDITFDARRATTIGQIFRELVSNCLKHAFPDRQPGKIEITLHRVNGDEIELVVSDDGRGLGEDFDFQNTGTLGMRMINALVAPLGGVVNIDGSDGTAVQVTLPENS